MDAEQYIVLKSRRYEYSPLDECAQEIRLLTLYPGTISMPVCISLESIPFTQENVPKFEALSYTWGSTETKVDIHVSTGNSCYGALAVTPNLAEALPYLRYEDRPRVLWIDAVCVNQEDLRERGLQVMRMADIYSRAKQVVVWLGTHSHDSSVAMDLMTSIASKIDVDWVLKKAVPLSKKSHWADPTIPLPLDESNFLALLNFINRSWFERLWIWQEVRLAAQEVTLMCGNRTIPLTSIMKTVFCLQRKPALPFSASFDAKKRGDDVYQLCDAVRPLTFDELIDQTKYTKCSDPRDRVFALLSLLNLAGEKIDIAPDYTKDYFRVYQEFVLSYIQYTQRLQILAGVEMRPQSGLSSWIQDWSTRKTTSPLRSVFASGLSKAEIQILRPGELQVKGARVDTVQLIERFEFEKFQETTYSKIISHLKSITSRIAPRSQFNPGSKQSKALCRALCSNRFSERWNPSHHGIITMQQSEECLAKMLDLPSDSEVQ